MNKGKQQKCSWKRSGKSIVFIVSLLLVIGVTFGGTITFLIDTDGPIRNLFKPSHVTTYVDETLDETHTIKNNVKIKNTGNTKAYIRAAVIVTWQDADGKVYGKIPVEKIYDDVDGDYVITWIGLEVSGGWFKGSDGFYYHKAPVAAGDFTSDYKRANSKKDEKE